MSAQYNIFSAANLITVTFLLLASGCASENANTRSTQAQTLKPTQGKGIDLSGYTVATVTPFTSARNDVDASIGVKFANEIALRLQADYGPIFQTVRKELPPLGTNGELIVTGTITQYQPGDRALRGLLIGLSAAKLKGELMLKDGADGRLLYAAPFDKLWAWGGNLGMSRGIEDLVIESEASVAATVARAKGWQPAKAIPKER